MPQTFLTSGNTEYTPQQVNVYLNVCKASSVISKQTFPNIASISCERRNKKLIYIFYLLCLTWYLRFI